MTILVSSGKQTTAAVDSSFATFMLVGVTGVGSPAAPTDSKSNTGFNARTYVQPSNGIGFRWFWKANPAVGFGHTVTIAQSFSTVIVIFTDEIDTASPFDQETTTFKNASSETMPMSSVTTTNANSLLFSGIAISADVTSPVNTFSFTNSFTVPSGGSNNATVSVVIGGAIGVRSVSATGTYDTTANWVGSNPCAGSLIAFKALAADTTAPTLTSPSGTGGAGVCSGSVSTNEGNGTLYTVFTGSATAPTATQVEAGQDNTGAAALRAVSQAVSAPGTQTVASGSITSGTRYAYFMHKDAAGNRSTVASSASFTVTAPDTTAPVLTSPTGTATGRATATVGATTDEGNGTLYGVVTTSATQPTIAQIKAGQNNAGTAAAYASSQSVTSTGAKTFSATGLTGGTTYYGHFVHTDAAGNDSNRVTTSSFTTATGVITFTDQAHSANNGVAVGALTLSYWVHDVSSGALITSGTVTTNSSGVPTSDITSNSIAASTQYRVDYKSGTAFGVDYITSGTS